jgi:hypothetical protein
MLTHSTLPRGGVVHAMSLSEALEDRLLSQAPLRRHCLPS